MKRTPLKRTGKLRHRRPWRAGVGGDRELRDAFTETVLREAGWRCARAKDGGCAGPLDPHHITPKDALKGHARARNAGQAATAALLWNPDNGLALCRRHHANHESGHDRVPRELLPERAIAFAAGVNMTRLLERSYPTTEGDRQ